MILINDTIVGTNLIHREFTDIMNEQGCKFFAVIFITVGLICTPIFAWKCIKMLVLYPKYF